MNKSKQGINIKRKHCITLLLSLADLTQISSGLDLGLKHQLRFKFHLELDFISMAKDDWSRSPKSRICLLGQRVCL